MKNTLLLSFIILLAFSCKKPDKLEPQYNAEIISYDSRKCYCLYGYKIKMGSDTLLSTSAVLYQRLGTDIDEPIKVNIAAILKKEDFCRYKYAEVSFIYTNRDAY